jgi:hypothetical protein
LFRVKIASNIHFAILCMFEKDPGNLWGQYLAVINQRESRLLNFLSKPNTMTDIVQEGIVYQRPRQPEEFYALTEEMIMRKHLDLHVSNSMVVKAGEPRFAVSEVG